MARSLDETKRLLRERFLGRGGIHGFGLSHDDQAIRVYISPEAEEADLLKELRESAKPYAVEVIREGRPRITPAE